MKQLPAVALKGFSYVDVSLYGLYLPVTFGGRAGSDVNASHVFLQGVLASIPLVGDMTHEGGARASARCEEHILCSVAISALAELRSPKLPEWKPGGLGLS